MTGIREDMMKCKCGCTRTVKKGNRYILGHNWKGKKNTNLSLYMKSLGDRHPSKRSKFKELMSGTKNPMKRPEIAKKVGDSIRALGDKNPSKRPEVRKKMSEAKKGKKRPDITGDRSPMKRLEMRKRFTIS